MPDMGLRLTWLYACHGVVPNMGLCLTWPQTGSFIPEAYPRGAHAVVDHLVHDARQKVYGARRELGHVIDNALDPTVEHHRQPLRLALRLAE
eukprot:1213578-Pyramimonas_sp.AAC.1